MYPMLISLATDPRMQGDPEGDRDFGMMLILMVILLVGGLVVMWLFDKWHYRERRHTSSVGARVMLNQAFKPSDDDELDELMREW